MASSQSDLSNLEALAASPSRGGALARMEPALGLPGGPGMAPAAGNELLHGGFNQTWLINGLRRRWLSALLLGSLVGALTGIILYVLFPASSRTTSYLMMQFGEETALGSAKPLNMQQIEQEQLAQLTLIKSNSVLESALSRKDINELPAVQANRPDQVQWMIEDLKVTFPNQGNVMEVRYDGEENPEDMEKIVDAIVKAYYDDVVVAQRIEQLKSFDDLSVVQKNQQKKLAEKMEELRRKVEVAEGGDSDTAEIEIQQHMKNVDFARGELAKLEKELRDNEVMKELAIRQANSPATIEILVSEVMDKDPMIQDYRKQLFAIDQEIMARQAIERRKNSPMIERLQQSRGRVAQMEADYRAQTEKELRDKYARMPNLAFQQAMAQYKTVATRLMEQKKHLEDDLKASQEQLMQLGSHDPAIEMLRNGIENDQEVIRDLELKLQQLAIEQAARANAAGDEGGRHEKVRIMQTAVAQPNINTYERYAIVGVGGLAAMALTCYGVAMMEFRKRKLNGPSDLDEGLGIRVLGVLPTTTPRKSLAGGNIVSAQVAESIDSVRATLMHASTKLRRQVILVTSPGTQEGATTVAANLAMSLARAGRRTLLVDGDLRDPSVHGLFGLSLDGGFSEVLRSEIDLADAVHPTQTESLYVLTAGICDSRAIRTLATEQLEPIIDQLRTRFDFIIIDSPPVLQVAESVSIGRFVDGAILTVLRDHSEVRNIHKAAELLDSLGIRLLGSVVNGVPVRADRRVARLHQSTQRALPSAKPAKAAKPAKPAKPGKDAKAKSDAPTEPLAPAATAILDEPAPPIAEKADDVEMDLGDFEIDFDEK